MTSRFACLALAVLALSLAGCAAASTTPAASAGAVVSNPEEAAQRVIASDSRFAGIGPRDENLIGQAAWYEVTRTTEGFRVVVRIGWGDCPSGCIDEHIWTYEVGRDGSVGLVGEEGDVVPPDAFDGLGGNAGGGVQGISGRVTVGPTCPVVQDPPDPACEDRPVEGAVLVVRSDDGSEVGRTMSGPTGHYSLALPAGHYTLVAEAVVGILGTPGPVDLTVPPDGSGLVIDLSYDSGIR